MFTLILVEDELYFLNGLKKILDWEKLNVEIIGTAMDGDEGYDLIIKNNPDIVITDICMAGSDGLAMIAKLRENGYTGHIIILTGYDLFDYAKSAIDLEVDKYILKPINLNELKEAVCSIENKICAERDLHKDKIREEVAVSPFMESVISYIDEHIGDEITVGLLAKRFHYNADNLSRMIKRYTGMRYIDYITNKRIERAKKLLLNTDIRIQDIHNAVGYKDMKHFRNVFIKLEGVSPSEYRRSRKK